MNNGFARLVDGMCTTLRSEVLPRIDDEYARSQIWGLINLLNTFKLRADWSAGFLVDQIAAQRSAIGTVATLLDGQAAPLPAAAGSAPLQVPPIAALLVQRDAGNATIAALLDWLEAHRDRLAPGAATQAEAVLRQAMRAEVDIELKHAPKPLFAQMSGVRDE